MKRPLQITKLSSLSVAISCFVTALFGLTPAESQLPTYRVTDAPVGNHPLGLTFDGDNIWVANSAESTVSKLRASNGHLLGTFDAGSYPQYVAFDGANIWVTNYPGTVTELRASDGVLLGTFPVGSRAAKGIAFDGTNIWVANVDANNVSKLRASDGKLLGTFPTDYGPYAILANGTCIWIAGEGSVTELRAGDGSQVGIYAIEHEPDLRSIVSDGHNIWVGQYATAGNPEQGITAINPRKGTVLGSVKVPKGPNGLAFDGTNIWVSDANAGTVSIVDPITKVDLQDIAVGKYPAGILFDGVSIWVANQASNTVSRITPE